MNLFGRPSFIEVYDKALSEKECDIIISEFEKSDYGVGWLQTGYHPEDKKCMQIAYDFTRIDQPVSNIIRPLLQRCIDRYYKEYTVLGDLSSFKIFPTYNIQKYETEDDGYKRWHCEHSSDDESSRRVLAWMFYLNNAKSGTEFMHYPNIHAKMGRCVIWPAGFTHTHRGVIPNKGLKYIATGWVSY